MNPRYVVGTFLAGCQQFVLSRSWFPLFRSFLGGSEWAYDVCRYAGTRDFQVLLDVGANVGQTALYLRRFFPAAQIHCFELSERTAATLRRNTSRYPNIHAHAIGLGRATGVARIRLQPSDVFNSLRHEVDASVDGADIEKVTISTADQFAVDHHIDMVDILKIDAQAFDLHVLEGAETLLRTHRVKFVYVEVTFDPGEQECQAFQPVHDYLLQCNFVLSHLYEQWNDGPRLGFCNALYCDPVALSRPSAS